ncbi:nitrilase-related carbon-nitrogen hydrolase [Colwellia sp. MEBiC06753]
MIRVAAAQFAVTNNVEANLATCLRMIEKASECQPDLIVLPEFVNHNSWYDDQEHCYQVSVDLNGAFLSAISAAVKKANVFLSINCTVRRDGNRVTGTSLMFSPTGELIGENNKQVLVGHENDFLDIATEQGPILTTEIGRLAMYSCMDGVINETPRCLSLRGAQVLCNNLNSFALDEGELHIPVRAAENKVFIVAANKVGPLIPEEILTPISEAISIPEQFLHGAGDSQIVAPDGTVLALAGKGEEVIWADINVSKADNKTRPDGTDIFRSRRPELYQSLGQDPQTQVLPAFNGKLDIKSAAISATSLEQALAEIKAHNDTPLICLPELFWLNDTSEAEQAISSSETIVNALANACQNGQLIATSIVKTVNGKTAHVGVLIDSSGIVFEQGQVHFSQRHHWSALTDSFSCYQSPYGAIAISLEDDAIYPESYRLIAMQGAEVVFAPLRQQEQWQSVTGLWERASENRVNIIAADINSANNIICPLQKEFTIMTPWQERKFDGLLSASERIQGQTVQMTTTAIVQPQAANNKVCSHRTHLINNRPWQLLQAML